MWFYSLPDGVSGLHVIILIAVKYKQEHDIMIRFNVRLKPDFVGEVLKKHCWKAYLLYFVYKLIGKQYIIGKRASFLSHP